MDLESFGPISKKWLEKHAARGAAFGRGERPDFVPIEGGLWGHCASLFGIARSCFYSDPIVSVRAKLAASELYDMQPAYGYSLATVDWVEDYGGKVEMPTDSSEAPYIVEHPIKRMEEIERFEVMDVNEISKGPTLTKQWKAFDVAERLIGRFFEPYSYAGEPYGLAANWIGFDKLLLLTAKEPELVHKLMKRVVEHSINANIAVVNRYGRCFIRTGSVFANSQSLSPKQILEFHINYLKEMVEHSLRAGAGPGISYHLCGDHTLDWRLHEIVPMTSTTRLQVGGPPFDLGEIVEVFGRKCIIVGNVPTALLQFGEPREIYDEAKRQLLAYKNSPKGFILAPACDIPSDTPPGNVHAMVKAVRDYGQLDEQLE